MRLHTLMATVSKKENYEHVLKPPHKPNNKIKNHFWPIGKYGTNKKASNKMMKNATWNS